MTTRDASANAANRSPTITFGKFQNVDMRVAVVRLGTDRARSPTRRRDSCRSTSDLSAAGSPSRSSRSSTRTISSASS